MKTDYPELEGKKIEFIKSDDSILVGIIRGVSYHVGITVETGDGSFKMVCLNRKIHTIGPQWSKELYRGQFYWIVGQLQRGTFDYVESRVRLGRSIHLVGNQNCAFI